MNLVGVAAGSLCDGSSWDAEDAWVSNHNADQRMADEGVDPRLPAAQRHHERRMLLPLIDNLPEPILARLRKCHGMGP